jgi:alpha-galactosidase
VAVQVRRRAGAIELENEWFRLVLDLASLRMSLQSHAHATRVEGFAPRVWLEGRPLIAERAMLDGYGEIRSRYGLATRIHVRCRSGLPLDFELDVDVGSDWPGLALGLRLDNRGDETLRIAGIEPFFWSRSEGGALLLPGPAEALRFFQMGYQSWSPAGFLPLGAKGRHPRIPLLRHIHCGPFTPLPRRDLHVSDFMTTLRAPGQAGLTLGFLSHRNFLTHVALQHRRERLDVLRAHVATETLPLAPHATLEAERLWIGLVNPDEDGVASWAERTGTEMGAPAPARVGSAWCSWYEFYTRLRAEDVRRNVRTLSELDSGIETIQIDDGYEQSVGDWLEPGSGFPEGIAPLAREIRAAGFRAGLWLAPLLVSRVSRVARSHPDWLLRRRDGRPRIALFNPAWKGYIAFALDPTHPEVQGWLAELGRTVRGFGFDYLKLDFLYAGAFRGSRYDAQAPSAAAYRRGIEAIRGGAGKDAFFLGCGAPLGPSIGLFDAMRIGPDVAPRWRSRLADAVYGIRAAPSAANSIRNVLARASLHQRLWLNDPDCVLLRDHNTKLKPREVQTLAGVIALSGGLVVVSDDMQSVGPTRRRLLRRLLPAVGRTPELGGLRDQIPDGLRVHFPDGSVWVLCVNLGERSLSPHLDTVELGFDGPAHLYDVWAERGLGTCTGELPLGSVPAHGCRLLRLSPVGSRARVVGSNLHVSGGALETTWIRVEEDGSVRVKLRLPGTREGGLVVAPGPDAIVPVRAVFRDELELLVRAPAPGLDESKKIPDG